MRNPVRTGDSCAAVSGYKFSGASLFAIRGEGGNKVSSQESEYSFEVPSFALPRVGDAKNFFAKKEE